MTITCTCTHGIQRGDSVSVSGRAHIVTRVVTPYSFEVRRTFWTWVRDVLTGRIP